MIEKTIFPREEKAEVLFDKILSDKWAYNKLFQTFCDNLFCNDDSGTDLSPLHNPACNYLPFSVLSISEEVFFHS